MAFLVAFALSQVFASGCGETLPDAGRLNVKISFEGTDGAQGPPPAVAAVQSVTETVYEGSTALVTGAAPTPDGASGKWRGAIAHLPVGVPLTIVAHAYDEEGTEIYSGTAQTVLNGGADSVTVDMVLTDHPVRALPHIEAIQVADHIAPHSRARVSIDVEGSAGETLDWALTGNGGAFDPPGGSVALSAGGSGSFTTSYVAPPDPGTYAGTVRITNSQGNSVEAALSLVVATGQVAPDPHVAPVVTSVTGSRQGHTVIWTATVSDDPGRLHYAWSAQLTGGSTPAFRAPTDADPAYLDGYDETVAGTVTLQVTDARGLTTTVAIQLAPGAFPEPTGDSLPYLDGDGVPELTAVPTLLPSTPAPGDEVTVSMPVDSDVGYFSACLYDDFDDAPNLLRMSHVACAEDAAGTAAAGTATASLRVPGSLSGGRGYWVLAMVCTSQANCDALTGTVYTSAGGAGTYARQLWSDAALLSSFDMGVAIPTYTIATHHDGDRDNGDRGDEGRGNGEGPDHDGDRWHEGRGSGHWHHHHHHQGRGRSRR